MDSRGRADRRALVDGAIAVALGFISVVLAVGVVDDPDKRLLAIGLALAHVGPLAVRRRAPLVVLATMAVTAALTVALGVPLVVLGPAVLVAAYTIGALCEPRRGLAAFVGLIVVMAVVVTLGGMTASTVVSDAIALAVAYWLGERARRAATDAEARRVEAAEVARRAAAAERLRIARELHDVVAHAMSVIAVQAGTGRFVIDESPDVARDALATIETTSRDALQEMRRLLSVLRDGDEASDLSPTPTLRDVGALVDVTEAAGTHVSLEVIGEAGPLPSGVDLCAFRVVQEALTNVRKHAQARNAAVTITYTPAAVQVEVVDDGRGAAGARVEGHGHIGMRERVGLYGGDLEVGGLAGGGFRVAASFPVAP